MSCTGTGMKSAVPTGDNQVRVPNGERTSEVDGIGASESEITRQLAGVAFDRPGEFDWPRRGPVLLPGSLGGGKITCTEVVVACGGGKGRTYLWISQPARHGGIAPVP